ncbi:MAG TPA: ABC transporter ATP-binding protein [Candidatus Pelethenecus faecipullorum]|uniref:ABC transporter ATP-binding protein n=1 Tax=Candidatus Pelethenecus faecipullorum TaxID=2840900 RepID=A0A9D1KIM9_9MOLU|nr:ABC transporter ATP-binding protein [Candidatus Pelethenecus faecipullorum]
MDDFDLEQEEFSDVDYKSGTKGPWKKIIKTVFLHKGYAIGLLIAVVILAVLDVCYPLVNSYAIKHYFESTDVHRFDNVFYIVALYIGVSLGYGITVFSFLFFAGKVEIHTSYELRKEAYLNLQKLPFSYFDQTAQGWIMARLTSDARKLSEIISWGCVDLLWGLLSMVGILGVLLVTNIQLSVIVLILLPIMIFLTIVIRKKMLSSYRDARRYNSKITAAYNEGFMGAKATKSLVIEDRNLKEFHSKALDYKKASLRAVFFSAIFGPVTFILCYVGVGTTLYIGGNMVIQAVLGVDILYLFIDYTVKFFDPIISVSRVIGDFQQAQASAERIISLIEQQPEITDRDDVIQRYGTIFEPKYENFEPLIGEIDFQNVTFKYAKGETVLKDFNLHIPAGSSVALVGHTGSGKSTIVNLICRFYEPTEGDILIDGHSYKDRSITWLHSNIGYVLQTPQLFSGTIMENVRYGNLKATDEDVIQALKLVAADGFIEKLENGYYSEVGEGGSKLSLGERQLISFARAIVADPKILVLDEATSSIDTQTEHLIQKAVEIVLKGRTSFMVAHRLSTVVNADLILVMRDGKVVESGKHHELLAAKGYYFELYKNQFAQEAVHKILG